MGSLLLLLLLLSLSLLLLLSLSLLLSLLQRLSLFLSLLVLLLVFIAPSSAAVRTWRSHLEGRCVVLATDFACALSSICCCCCCSCCCCVDVLSSLSRGFFRVAPHDSPRVV